MDHQFDILKKNRNLILKVIDGFSMDQLNKVPNGFNNNIVWNLAHLVVTQQLLCYQFSGLEVAVSDELIGLFRKGTSPKKGVSSAEFEEMKELFLELPLQFERDYSDGIFKSYHEYTTSLNVTLSDIRSAISFNNFHEGIHLGAILALRKLI